MANLFYEPEPDPNLPGHDPIGEEMIDMDLDPNKVNPDAYLAARRRMVMGLIDSADLRKETLRIHREMFPDVPAE